MEGSPESAACETIIASAGVSGTHTPRWRRSTHFVQDVPSAILCSLWGRTARSCCETEYLRAAGVAAMETQEHEVCPHSWSDFALKSPR